MVVIENLDLLEHLLREKDLNDKKKVAKHDKVCNIISNCMQMEFRSSQKFEVINKKQNHFH